MIKIIEIKKGKTKAEYISGKENKGLKIKKVIAQRLKFF